MADPDWQGWLFTNEVYLIQFTGGSEGFNENWFAKTLPGQTKSDRGRQNEKMTVSYQMTGGRKWSQNNYQSASARYLWEWKSPQGRPKNHGKLSLSYRMVCYSQNYQCLLPRFQNYYGPFLCSLHCPFPLLNGGIYGCSPCMHTGHTGDVVNSLFSS